MRPLYYHIILIGLLLAMPIVSSPEFDSSFRLFRSEPFIRDFLRYLLLIGFFYLNLYIFLPKFYEHKKLLFAASVVASFAFIIWFPHWIMPSNPPGQPQFRDGALPMPGFAPDSSISRRIFSGLLPFLFAFLGSSFFYSSRKQAETEKARVKAELLNLKYQLQPHFLFNILNSIYSLALIKSDDAPNGILKLSNVMRYVVSESEHDWVPLEKELQYIKDYIALQLIRTDDSLDFSYEETGSPGDLKIAPMLLITFIENAFKYGFNAEEHSEIKISSVIESNQLNFSVFNKKVNHNVPDKMSTKIGIRNTLLRLEEFYPDRHDIFIEDLSDIYAVNLKIQLDD